MVGPRKGHGGQSDELTLVSPRAGEQVIEEIKQWIQGEGGLVIRSRDAQNEALKKKTKLTEDFNKLEDEFSHGIDSFSKNIKDMFAILDEVLNDSNINDLDGDRTAIQETAEMISEEVQTLVTLAQKQQSSMSDLFKEGQQIMQMQYDSSLNLDFDSLRNGLVSLQQRFQHVMDDTIATHSTNFRKVLAEREEQLDLLRQNLALLTASHGQSLREFFGMKKSEQALQSELVRSWTSNHQLQAGHEQMKRAYESQLRLTRERMTEDFTSKLEQNIAQLQQGLEHAKQAVEAKEKEVQQLKYQIEKAYDLVAEAKKSQEHLSEQNSDILDKLRAKLKQVTAEKESAEQKAISFGITNAGHDAKFRGLQAELDETNRGLKEADKACRKEVERLVRECDDLLAERDDAKHALEESDRVANTLRVEIENFKLSSAEASKTSKAALQDLQDSLDKTQDVLSGLQTEVSDKTADADRLNAEVDQLQEQIRALELELEQAKAAAIDESKVENMERQLDNLGQEKRLWEQRARQTKSAEQAVVEELNKLRPAYDDNQAELQKLRNRIKDLERPILLEAKANAATDAPPSTYAATAEPDKETDTDEEIVIPSIEIPDAPLTTEAPPAIQEPDTTEQERTPEPELTPQPEPAWKKRLMELRNRHKSLAPETNGHSSKASTIESENCDTNRHRDVDDNVSQVATNNADAAEAEPVAIKVEPTDDKPAFTNFERRKPAYQDKDHSLPVANELSADAPSWAPTGPSPECRVPRFQNENRELPDFNPTSYKSLPKTAVDAHHATSLCQTKPRAHEFIDIVGDKAKRGWNPEPRFI